MKTLDSQNALIKGWLLNGYSLTQMEALNQFGCFRLAARISDLRDEGLHIIRDMVTLENGKRVARYICLNKKMREAAEKIKLDF
jgi:hypothetical protein